MTEMSSNTSRSTYHQHKDNEKIVSSCAEFYCENDSRVHFDSKSSDNFNKFKQFMHCSRDRQASNHKCKQHAAVGSRMNTQLASESTVLC